MKRAIAGQRGSVRGAPPDVYIGFASFDDEGEGSEHWDETIRFFKQVCIVWPLGLLTILFVLYCLLALIRTPLEEPPGLGPFD
jgi:hypothetical protein